MDADIDADGLNDKQEREQGTSPWRGDTDYDSLRDGWEVANGFEPKAASDGSLDADADGYTNAEEYQFGKNPRFKEDTDGDGMPDGWEVANGLNPLAEDTLEDLDGDRVPNIFEFQRGTLANDAAAKPAATFVVNPATGGASTTDNVYATIQEAVNKAQGIYNC